MFQGCGGSVWWRNFKSIKESANLINGQRLLDNIDQKIEDETFIEFWNDPWLDGILFKV